MSDLLYFDRDGDLKDFADFFRKIRAGEKLAGEDAIAFLAEEFASETHGNYCAETLYRRAEMGKQYRITVEKI